jgi:hypothetical protein
MTGCALLVGNEGERCWEIRLVAVEKLDLEEAVTAEDGGGARGCVSGVRRRWGHNHFIR